MGGFFGVTSREDCVMDLFFGTDYHSHLGTRRGGMAVYGRDGFQRSIHNIENSPFRTKFERDVEELKGNSGIGSISDNEPQPLLIQSHLGSYAIVTVGKINNETDLIRRAFENGHIHFMEMSGGRINATELTAAIINQKESIVEGLLYAQEMIEGSMSILILAPEGIYASRDRYGRTPVMIGRKENACCVSFESFAYINLGYRDYAELGPGEIVLVKPTGIQNLSRPRPEENLKKESGESVYPDIVAGVPDSGIAHAIGYANESGIPFARPFIKYTPTWPRSFMPQNQSQRNLIAKMKLIPIDALIRDKSLLLIDDSIVRGTQLGETTEFLYESGAKEVHIRPACPPLLFGCKYLNFSRSNSDLDLITRRIIQSREGDTVSHEVLADYADPDSRNYQEMVEEIRRRLNFTSLRFHRLDDLVKSIGLPPEKLCTYCWSGKE